MTTNQSSNLRPCPFCGKEPQEITLNGEPKVVCRCLVREPNIWNTRPIEDALNARIAELERDFDMLFRAVIAANKQSRKNTQTQTFVYGKESEE